MYRSCEDIVEAVKPLLNGAVLLMSDDVICVSDRVYVKATATLSIGGDSVSVTGMAREALTKKGMDDSQITGSSSSYARKYALNGLFCIDDTKDADAGISDTDAQWVAVVKENPERLNEIADVKYKSHIKQLAGV